MLGEKTKKNLADAFAGESMARNKYDYFASVFEKAGYVQIANIFKETALNEKEHAKLWAKQLALISQDLKENLKAAVAGEMHETSVMYPQMEKEALEEGHADIAKLFKEVGEVEAAHAARYRKLLENVENDLVFKKPEVKRWKCNNCGHIHEGAEAPKVCPACSHPQAYFEVLAENY
ncbi:MAG: rubrerythrin family protein [Candidatus Falkowbacteria bacterium]|nr:rubrerythrin family protein [Candidatus Falkowbacteria bacterium]